MVVLIITIKTNYHAIILTMTMVIKILCEAKHLVETSWSISLRWQYTIKVHHITMSDDVFWTLGLKFIIKLPQPGNAVMEIIKTLLLLKNSNAFHNFCWIQIYTEDILAFITKDLGIIDIKYAQRILRKVYYYLSLCNRSHLSLGNI